MEEKRVNHKIHVVNETMEIRDCAGKWTYHKKYDCYCLEDVAYTPVPKAVRFQRLSIFVPAAYLNPDGTVKEGKKGNYTTRTAPVIFENNASGYAEMEHSPLDGPRNYGGQYLDRGMVYIHCGCRGRQTMDGEGIYIGKSPVTLVDLKTAIRFVKHNRDAIPGQVDRMISVGWSAGGAMSALIGVTGDNASYQKLLEENGAFMEESDAVYGAQVYCPIIDLEHADAAYEWQYRGQYQYDPSPFAPGGTMTEFEKALSFRLAEDYVEYFNGLGLRHPDTGEPFLLGKDGRSGNAYEYLLDALGEAATTYFTKLEQGKIKADYTVSDYLDGNYQFETIDMDALMERNRLRDELDQKAREAALAKKKGGEEAEENGEFEGFGARVKLMGPPPMKLVRGDEKHGWLHWDGSRAEVTDLDAFESIHRPRMKACPSFDFLTKSSGENQVFGNATTDFMHFSAFTAKSIAKLKDRFPEESTRYEREYLIDLSDSGMEERICLLNPFGFIGTGETCKQAEHFRIHVGTCDPDTSFLMSLILAVKLKNAGHPDVLYHMIWDQPHSEADYEGECCDWVEGLF